MALDLEIKTGGVWTSYISQLVHESLAVHQVANRLSSTCVFDLIITGVVREDVWTVGTTRVEDGDVITGHLAFAEPKVEVRITDGATTYFAGILSRITKHPKYVVSVRDTVDAESQIITCSCHDYSVLLDESIIDEWASYVAKTDEFIIDDIFDKFVNSAPYPNAGIGRDAHVAGGAYTFEELRFNHITVRECLDQLAILTGYKWYVSYDKELHYSAGGDAEPAWHLSDAPDDVTSFSFLDPIKEEEDATNLINRVFVMGEGINEWFIDQDSVDEHGVHQAITEDTSLKTDADLAVRGNAMLEKYKDPVVTYTLRTYTDGLRAGMSLALVCAHLDLNLTDLFLIHQLVVKFPDDGAPIYEITLGGFEYAPAGTAVPMPPGPPPPSLPREWWMEGIEFTSIDHNTVEWSAGTVKTSDGLTFNIIAGTTGNIDADPGIILVYFNAGVSITTLRLAYDPGDVVGYDKVHIATCWNGWVWAGFEQHIPSNDVTPRWNVVNIGDGELTGTQIAALTIGEGHLIADSVTAGKIDVAQLNAISADMGVLTAGEIRMYDGVWDAAGNDGFRITPDEICGQENGVDQVIITAVDGKFHAGAGAVTIDADGIRLIGTGAVDNPRRVLFQDDTAGDRTLGWVGAGWPGGANLAINWLVATRDTGDPWPANVQVQLAAVDTVVGTDVRVEVHSDKSVRVSGEEITILQGLLRVGTAAADLAPQLENGCMYYNTTTHKLRLRANGAWVNLN